MEPVGPIANVTGLKFIANGKKIPWRRDLLDVFTFHVDVPEGAKQLEISFDYLEPSGMGGPAAGTATDKLMVLNWNQILLYPAGTPAARLTYKPKLQLPAGWRFGTALHGAAASGGDIDFEPVSLERLVDSPLVAGQYYRAVDLTPPGEPIHHEIDIVAESEAALAMPADVQRGMTNLVAETGKLFGSRHYREYHFLLTLSDHTGHFGVEHHESNDSRLPERVFLSPGAARELGGLLAHEFAHSWSGNFGGQRTRARRIMRLRWKPTCSGCTKGTRRTLVTCLPRAAGSGHRKIIVSRLRARPRVLVLAVLDELGVQCLIPRLRCRGCSRGRRLG